MTHEDTTALFLRTYANLPLNARNEIIVVVDDEPMTWRSAKVEIDNDTRKSQQILKQLIELDILKDEQEGATI